MRHFLPLVFCFFSLVSKAQGLVISPLSEDVYVYTTYGQLPSGPFPANGMFFVTEQEVILIDAPWDSLQLFPLLDSIRMRHHKPVTTCIVTHFHDDRAAALHQLNAQAIKTLAYHKTCDLLKQRPPDSQPTHCMQTSDTLLLSGQDTFRIFFPGAGHSPDNIVVWHNRSRTLYGGCFVKSTESRDLGNLSHANPKSWKRAVKLTMKVFPRPAYVIPGHQGWADGAGLRHTLKLLQKK